MSTDVAELRKDEWEAWSIASLPAAETDSESNWLLVHLMQRMLCTIVCVRYKESFYL